MEQIPELCNEWHNQKAKTRLSKKKGKYYGGGNLLFYYYCCSCCCTTKSNSNCSQILNRFIEVGNAEKKVRKVK